MVKETIRYEAQCQFCKDRLDGDSASEVQVNIGLHDISHAFCGRCRITRVTVPEAVLCDDCYHDSYYDAGRPIGVDLSFGGTEQP